MPTEESLGQSDKLVDQADQYILVQEPMDGHDGIDQDTADKKDQFPAVEEQDWCI